MRRFVFLLSVMTLAAASLDSSPLQFAPCKSRLLRSETDVVIKNKDWKGSQFVNIVTQAVLKPSCVQLSRWTELDITSHPAFIIFHQKLHYRLGSEKGHAKFTELYQISRDHYVFKYSHGKDEPARVHVKWLKFIPGILEIQYMCSNDFIFSKNSKDLVLVTTPSAMFSSTLGTLTKNVLQGNHFRFKTLTMIPNCDCKTNEVENIKKQCANEPISVFLNK